MLLVRPGVDLAGGLALLGVALLQTVDPVIPPGAGSNLATTILATLGASGVVTYVIKRGFEHYVERDTAERAEEKAERDRRHAENNARFEALTKQIKDFSERDNQRVGELLTVYRTEVEFWRQMYVSERERCTIPLHNHTDLIE